MSRGYVQPERVAYVLGEASDFNEVLGELRLRAGFTCEGFDAHMGWADRYTAKLEHPDTPSGKRGLLMKGERLTMSNAAELWAIGLGVRLVVVDEATAEEIGAVPAPRRAPGERRPAPNRKVPLLSRGSTRSAAA